MVRRIRAFSNKYHNMGIIARATFWFMICSLIQKGLAFISTPIFSRLMSRSQFGQYTAYLSWLQLIQIITTIRLDYGVYNKGMSKYSDDRDGYASAMFGLTTILTTAVVAVYSLFWGKINEIIGLPTIVIIGMLLELYILPAISFWSLRERYEFHYQKVITATILLTVLNTGLGILGVLLVEEKGIARILSCVVAQLIVGIPVISLLLRNNRNIINVKYWKFAFLFNIPLIPHYFSTYAVEHSDKIMIQKMVGLEAEALYGIAYNIGGIIKIFTSALSNTLVPLQYQMLGNKEYKKLQDLLLKIMLIVAGSVCLLSSIGPDIVYIMGGKSYHEGIYVIPPVAASVYFSFGFTLYANIEFYLDRNKYAMYISFIGALVNLLLNYLAIPRFGFVAAAYTTLFSYGIYFVGHVIYVELIMKKQTYENCFKAIPLIALGVGSAICCYLIGLTYSYPIIRYSLVLIGIIIGCINSQKIIELLKKG